MIELPKGNPASWMRRLLGLDIFQSAIFGEILFSTENGEHPFCQSLKHLSGLLDISYSKVREVISFLEGKGLLSKQVDGTGRTLILIVKEALSKAFESSKTTAVLKHPTATTKHSTATTKLPSATTKHSTEIIGSSLIRNPKDLKDVKDLKQDNTIQNTTDTHEGNLSFDIDDITDFVNGKPTQEKVILDLKPCDQMSVQSFVNFVYKGNASFKLQKDCVDLARDSKIPAYEMNTIILDAFFHNRRRIPPKSYLVKVIERISTYSQPSSAWETYKLLQERKFAKADEKPKGEQVTEPQQQPDFTEEEEKRYEELMKTLL